MFTDLTRVLNRTKKLETKDFKVDNPKDESILNAINDIYKMGLVSPVLVGNQLKILKLSMGFGNSPVGYLLGASNSIIITGEADLYKSKLYSIELAVESRDSICLS